MSAPGACWVGGCGHPAAMAVSTPSTPLVSPLETCTDHLGDLLGNVTKAAVRVGAQDLTIQIVVL